MQTEEAKIIDQWGAFWFTRKALRIKTNNDSWTVETVLVFAKLWAILLAFLTDVTALILIALLFLVKNFFKYAGMLSYHLGKQLLSELLRRLGFLLTLVLTIALLYLIFSHWTEFTTLIDKLWQHANK